MSPMSTWLRNWTPLTTRPSRTSRQGMRRRASIGGNSKRQTPNPKQIRRTKPCSLYLFRWFGVSLAFGRLAFVICSAGQRLLQREFFLVQRPADNRPGGIGGLELAQVIERRDTARGLDFEGR